MDNYLNSVTKPQKTELKRLQNIIAKTVPEAIEVISYGMPGYKYKGKYLITFGAFKNHLSVFPGSHAIDALQKELSEYKQSKGTVQFTIDKPLPESLIKQIVEIRKADIENG